METVTQMCVLFLSHILSGKVMRLSLVSSARRHHPCRVGGRLHMPAAERGWLKMCLRVCVCDVRVRRWLRAYEPMC